MLAFYITLVETEEQKQKVELLYTKYKGLIYRTALQVTHQHHLAEDIVHETFLQFLRIIDKIRVDSEKELTRFVRLVAHNQAVNYVRRLNKMKPESEEELQKLDKSAPPDPESIAVDKMVFENFVERVQKLDPIYRTPLELKIVGYKIEEIAHILELPPSTVRVRLFRARKLLLKKTEEQ